MQSMTRLKVDSEKIGVRPQNVHCFPFVLSFRLALGTCLLSERVHFHSVGVTRVLRAFSRGSKIACGVTPWQRRVSKRGAVGQMHVVSEV